MVALWLLLAGLGTAVVSADSVFDNQQSDNCATLLGCSHSAFHYYKCCGNFHTDCCLHLQTWLWVVIAVFVAISTLCCIGCVVRCICCCGSSSFPSSLSSIFRQLNQIGRAHV